MDFPEVSTVLGSLIPSTHRCQNFYRDECSVSVTMKRIITGLYGSMIRLEWFLRPQSQEARRASVKGEHSGWTWYWWFSWPWRWTWKKPFFPSPASDILQYLRVYEFPINKAAARRGYIRKILYTDPYHIQWVDSGYRLISVASRTLTSFRFTTKEQIRSDIL